MESFDIHQDKQRSSAIIDSRVKIANMSYTLNNISFGMVWLSLLFFMLKLADFQGINERLVKFENTSVAAYIRDKHLHKEIYYTMNGLTLALSAFAFISTLYIKLTLQKHKIFNKDMYRKFMIAGGAILVVNFLLGIYFVSAVASVAKLSLRKWIEAVMALSLMCSDGRMKNAIEILCTAFWVIGIYAMIILSNMIEEEI